jgi:hypothetical protein
MTQQNKHEQADTDPEGMVMDDQGASYGSSYNESTPGEVEANRAAALREQDEPTQRRSDADDR